MKKKLLSILTSVVCAASICGGVKPLTADAETYSDSMQYGDYLYYKQVDEDEDGTYDYVQITGCNESAETVDIPAEINGLPVNSIGNGAFCFCGFLTDITISENVAEISPDAFNICNGLENINVSDDNEKFSSEDGILFNKDKTKLIRFPSGKVMQKYIVDSNITEISDNAFDDCEALTEITIPESVMIIGKYALTSCKNLININVSENNKNYCSENGVLLNKECTELIRYPMGKKETKYVIQDSVMKVNASSFSGCETLTSVTLPDKLNSIGEFAFSNCRGLTEIVLPEKLSDLGKFAFFNCISLEKIVIPDSVECIDDNTFFYCQNLKSITIENSECVIYDSANTICDKYDDDKKIYVYNGIIYGYENSTAQAYSEKYDIKFASIGSEYEGVKGDADGNGKIAASDVAFIAKLIAKASLTGDKVSVEEYPNADYNGDGKISAQDAALIAKYVAEQALKK